MISERKTYCRNFETGLDVAKLREDPELRRGRTAIPDEKGETGTKVVANFCSNAGDVFYDGMNRYPRGRMQTYAE
jgi:hypothetical protein